MPNMPTSVIPFAIVLLAGALAVMVGAEAQAAPTRTTATYKVGKRVLVGHPKSVCVIEGSWANGAPFRYETWDSCAKMSVSAARLVDYQGWPARGPKGSLTVADIPSGSEVIEIGNGASSVLVFRGANGEAKDVLIRD